MIRAALRPASGEAKLFVHPRCKRLIKALTAHRELIVEPIGLDVETIARPIDLAAMFGNANPLEIEIGVGKGTFLTDQARARPDTNFIGIEYARWFWRYASDRLRRSNCLNAR